MRDVEPDRLAAVLKGASHLLWMTAREEIDRLYDLVTVDAARAMNVANFALAPGNPAHLVVLREPNTVEALRNHSAPAHVVSHGAVLDLERMAAWAAG